MLSVIIATLDSERTLLPTLSALVPGAMDGLVSEVIVADGGSRDETAVVADVAGCNFMTVEGSTGQRLQKAAAVARAPWLLFVRPGIVLDAPWTGEASHFVQQADKDRAAVFRRGARGRSALREALSLALSAFGARPRPEQSLLLPHEFYDLLGGHSDRAADPETELLRRIGRRRLVTLDCRAFAPKDT
jgi:hypothetical protein